MSGYGFAEARHRIHSMGRQGSLRRNDGDDDDNGDDDAKCSLNSAALALTSRSGLDRSTPLLLRPLNLSVPFEN